MSSDHSIVFVADPRYSGGTSRALAAEARALQKAGLSAAFCPVLGPTIRRVRPVSPPLVPFLADGTLRVVDPRAEARARLVVVHHPSVFTNLPHEPWRIRAERVVLVLHHPPRDGLGAVSYDLDRILANLAEVFEGEVVAAPVGPVVRGQLGQRRLLEEDWHNLLDFDDWQPRSRALTGEIVLGRHSRPQLSKFPDTRSEALSFYPDRPDVRVRMLGAPQELRERYDPLPPGWELLDFDAEEPADFLGTLDYFVYAHGKEWVEAFGYAVLEAIASGVPAILPAPMRKTFGDLAHYAGPDGAWPVIERLEADPEGRARHVLAARELARARYAIEDFLPRLDRVAPGWRGGQAAARIAPPVRALLMTSNGIGLGHLARMMAVADRLGDRARCAFFTLSQGFSLAAEAGYLTQFVPFHAATGAPLGAWNRALLEELGDFIDLFSPDVLVFDGNVPYAGLVAALDARPGLRRVWMRRALWAPGTLPEREEAFDLIVEPGEFSARFDDGGCAGRGAVPVAPILNVRPEAVLPPAEARAALGLPDGPVHVGLMLGAGANYDLNGIRDALLADIARRPDVEVTEIVSPYRPDRGGDAAHRRIRHFPAAEVYAAFDFLILGAGYNSFHEALSARVPAVFVPNEAPEMDRQILRARHAAAIGCGMCLRASDRVRLASVLDRMFDPAARADMRRRMSRVTFGDGAAEAAELILSVARMSRLSKGF
jgi:hypothetical protein